jgi:hypothetical protein
MAKQLPRIDETQRGPQRWHRDWYSYEAYQSIHESCMESLYNEGLITRDTIEFQESLDENGATIAVHVVGRVACINNVVVQVSKYLSVRRGRDNRLEVLGNQYSYYAWQRPRRSLFRYDNAHGGLETLHLHRFDTDGRQTSNEPVAIDELPRLDFIIKHAVSVGAIR